MRKVKIEILKLLFVFLFLAAVAPAHVVRANINQINDSTYLMGINNVLLVDTDDMLYNTGQKKWIRVKYTYQSSDPSVAVINGELLRAKKEGKAVITQYANGTYAKKFTVNVMLFDYRYNGKTLILTGYHSKIKLPSKLVIPEKVAGVKVTEIGSHAFENAKVDSVLIGANITKIGESAFENCTATKIMVKGSATLDKYAFISCKKLTDLELLGNVKLEANVVAGCSKLKALTFQGDATIGSNGLHYAEATELNFMGKAYLTGESIIECDNLKRINFQGPATLKKSAIEDTRVEEIIFFGKAELGTEAISMCENLREITFRDEAVLNNMALQCEGLENLSFQGKAMIKKEGIFGSGELKNITFGGNTTLMTKAISASSADTIVFEGDAYLSKKAISGCGVEAVTFKGKSELEQYAFSNCAAIKDIICDESKTTLHGNPFYTSNEGVDFDLLIIKLAYRHNQTMWLYSENTKKAYARIVDCMSQFAASDSDVTKLRKVHDWIANNIEYDYTLTHHNIMDALLLGKSICGGYSRTLELVLELMGIPNAYIISKSMDHAWNQVYLDGNWYNIDVTWDDPTGWPIHYKYFLKSDAAISDHTGYETMGCTSTLYDNIK